MAIKFHALQHFLALERQRSFTAAAAELHISQSALTKSMQGLEKRLGVPLFHRLPSGVELTVYGKALAEHARLISAEVELAETELAALREGALGTVRIGAGPGWLVDQLPVAIQRLHKQRPNVKVTVADGLNEELFQLLRQGKVDVVVCSLSEEALDPLFEYHKLVSDQFLVVASRDHPLVAQGTVSLKELTHYPWVLPDTTTFTRQRFSEVFLSHGLRPPEPLVEANSFVLRSSVVRLGGYLSFHAEQNMKGLSKAGLRSIKVPGVTWRRSAGIVTRKRTVLSTATRMLLDALVEVSIEAFGEAA